MRSSSRELVQLAQILMQKGPWTNADTSRPGRGLHFAGGPTLPAARFRRSIKLQIERWVDLTPILN